MTTAPADRVRTLLLRGDNVLKSHGRGDAGARVARARDAFEEAREVARDPAVDPAVRALIERRLATLDPNAAAGAGGTLPAGGGDDAAGG